MRSVDEAPFLFPLLSLSIEYNVDEIGPNTSGI